MPKRKNQPPKPGNRRDRKRQLRTQEEKHQIGRNAPSRGQPVGGLKKFGKSD